ncbi:MAG: phage tail protein [Lentisphaerae bacterium]|nr:phage tail protein [Lentisphaerota bacterium]
MDFYSVLTNIGQAALANAGALGQTINLSHMAVGDGNGSAVTPNETATALVNEVYRGSLNSLSTDSENPNWLIAELVIPTNVGGWTVHEVGLFDSNGNLFAYGNFPETYKPQLSEGASRDLVIRMVLQVSGTANVELKIDPAVVLATRDYADIVAQVKIAAHEAAINPHPGKYAPPHEHPYEAVGSVAAHKAEGNPHPQYSLSVGTVIGWCNPTAPWGFIECNGAALSRTTYANLFASIGTIYGVGDGSSTFNAPDLRGEFIRGWDNGRGIDSGRSLGSWQADDFKNHTHLNYQGHQGGGGGKYASGDDYSNSYISNPPDTSATGGAETRPRNIALMYCIKY